MPLCFYSNRHPDRRAFVLLHDYSLTRLGAVRDLR